MEFSLPKIVIKPDRLTLFHGDHPPVYSFALRLRNTKLPVLTHESIRYPKMDISHWNAAIHNGVQLAQYCDQTLSCNAIWPRSPPLCSLALKLKNTKVPVYTHESIGYPKIDVNHWDAEIHYGVQLAQFCDQTLSCNANWPRSPPLCSLDLRPRNTKLPVLPHESIRYPKMDISHWDAAIHYGVQLAQYCDRTRSFTLFKKKKKNLRPISNLAFISKLIECAVCNQYNTHIFSNDIAEIYQSAYKASHSVETAIVCVHNDIVRAIDNKQAVLLVLLDLSAAFDTVDHCKLLEVLKNVVGISGTALAWFASYLQDRTQKVSINNEYSPTAKLKCGVPQGSVLGPVLFTTYLLPLGEILRKLGVKFHCYADDTQLYIPFYFDDNTCVSDMERYLAIIHSWMTSNLLKLNADKTETLLVSRNIKPCPVPQLCINFNGEKIVPSKQVRNLGVIFDSKFSLEAHVNKVCQASYLQLYNISQVRKCLSKAACESLIHAFISSRLDSMNAILHGLPDYLIEKLQKVQNHAARVLCGLRKYDHITPALQALHWLPIKKRIEYKIAMLCYKCIHMLAPKYLCDMISIYTPRRRLRSSLDKYLLNVPKVRTGFGERAFSYSGPKIWNDLPYDVRASESLNSFKQKLKTHLFKSAYIKQWF